MKDGLKCLIINELENKGKGHEQRYLRYPTPGRLVNETKLFIAGILLRNYDNFYYQIQ